MPPEQTMVQVKNWWESVRRHMYPVPKPHSSDVSCDVSLHVRNGSDLMYHDITTKYATWPSGAHVDFMSYEPYGFGVGVPVYYAPTLTGYSFEGALPVCTKSWVCTNGQPIVCKVALSGEVNTSVEPDEMTYTYSIDLYCGGVLTCNEYGTFKGTRKAGAADGVEGSFYGTQEWTAKCCPTRHHPFGAVKGTGKEGYKRPAEPRKAPSRRPSKRRGVTRRTG